MSTNQSSASAGLPLLASSDDGCRCGCDANTKAGTPRMEVGAMSTQTYLVTGMTCGHCVQAVTSELMSLDGAANVSVQLVPDGTSTVTVTSGAPLDEAQVESALDEAGNYHLA